MSRFTTENFVRLLLGFGLAIALSSKGQGADPSPESLIGAQIYAKSDGAIIEIDKQQVGVAGDMTYPCRVRTVNGSWLWIWIGGKKTEGWIHRTDVCTAPEAVQFFSEKIQANPKDDFALLQRARAYDELGEHDKAIEDDSKLIELKPKAYAYNERGLRWFAKKDYAKATDDFSAAIKVDGQFVLAYINRGNAARALKQLDKSLIDFNHAVRLDPKNALAYYNAANAWQEKGKLDLALKNYDEALNLDPKSALAYLNRGNVQLELAEIAKASDDFRRSVAFDGKLPEARNNLAWLLATNADPKIRDGKLAVEHATEACRLTDFKKAGFIDTLAAAYAETGDFERAIESAQKAADGATDEEKADIHQRLELYKAKKPFREPLAKKT